MKSFLIYLAGVNALTFIMYGADKLFAIKHLRRIRERTLIIMALIGGSIGASFGMEMFRHKTKHLKFKIGIPLILLLHIIIGLIWFFYGDEIYGKLLLYMSRMRFCSLNSGVLG